MDLKKFTLDQAPGPKLGYLAATPRNHILVTLSAALGVIRGAKAVLNGFNLLENKSVIVERAEWHDVVIVQCLESRSLLEKAVGFVVEAGGRLGCVLSDCRLFRAAASREGLNPK